MKHFPRDSSLKGIFVGGLGGGGLGGNCAEHCP